MNTEAAEALRTKLCKRDASQPALPFTMSGEDYLAAIVPRSGVCACPRVLCSQSARATVQLLLSAHCKGVSLSISMPLAHVLQWLRTIGRGQWLRESALLKISGRYHREWTDRRLDVGS